MRSRPAQTNHEGESGAEEFRESILRAIAHADEDALIFLAKAIADNAEEMH